MGVAEGDTATAARGSGGGAGHHDERDCPFRLANTGAIGFLSAAAAAAVAATAAAVAVAGRRAWRFFAKFES